jgi:hypothetical protein
MAGTNLSPMGSPAPILEFIIGDEPVAIFPKYFKKMVILERSTTGNQFAFFRFFDDQWVMLENLFIKSKEDIKFRYGYDKSTMSKWKHMLIAIYDQEYTLDGSWLNLWLVDQTLLCTGALSRSFGTIRISEIVQQIAIESGMDYVIEPTKGQYSFRQNNISSVIFIRDWLLPRALSEATGRGDYRFYVKNGRELHFHSPDYSKVVYKTYKIFNEGDHTVLKFRYRLNLNKQFGPGINRELYVQGYDPINKKTLDTVLTNESTPEKVRLGKKMPSHLFKEGGKFIGVPFKTQEQVDEIARQIWYENDMDQVNAKMTMICDPGLEPGRLVDIALQNDYTGGLANGSGRYLVNDIITTLSLKPLKFRSIIFLGRNAVSIGEIDIVGVDPKATPYAAAITDVDDSTTDEFSEATRQFGQGVRRIKEAIGL